MTTPNPQPPVSANELLKQSSPTLAGHIAQTLADPSIDRFSEDDSTFMKFHGIYQGDDRDLRKTGKKYIFMVRLRLPGGVLKASEYLVCDELASKYANNTLRVTSRQSLQFHGVVKAGLGPLMKNLNSALLTTLAACGDVNRNVMAPPRPSTNRLGEQVLTFAREVATALSPRTPAYHSIWVEGVELNLQNGGQDFIDPLYGKTYLPRKLKMAFAIPPVNDVDILTNCVGFIAIADDKGELAGFNLAAGGGMGRSHGNETTFPRLADVIGFLPPEKVVDVARAVLTIHRDFGDRGNRKHARLKYILADRGAKWFREELEQRLGFGLESPRPFQFTTQSDAFGWHKQVDGRLFLGLFVEGGRIKDTEASRTKTGLREVISKYQPEIRLTPANNVILANMDPDQQSAITDMLQSYGVQTAFDGATAGTVPQPRQASLLRRSSMACVALPTCGLALAEAERFLPDVITRVEALMEEIGLSDQEITIRMTGCPNGCARPYMAEIGLVGKAPGKYQIYLGGNEASTRLNRLWKESVSAADLVAELRLLLVRYVEERIANERFGDFVERALWRAS